jgi:hypothetical protein
MIKLYKLLIPTGANPQLENCESIDQDTTY